MFQYMFLQRLPVILWTLLGEQEPSDIKSMATRADKLCATHKPQSNDLVASVDLAEEQPAQIAAVQKIEPAKKKKFAWKKSGGGGQAVADSSSVSGSGPGGLTH